MLKTENRFGDVIEYDYTAEGTEDTELGEKYNKLVITDTCSRKIVIERKPSGDNKQTMSISVTDENGNVIGGNVQHINLRKVQISRNDDKIEYATVADSYVNQEGYKTDFEYKEDDISRYQHSQEQSFYILEKVTTPTGAVSEYEYLKTDHSFNYPEHYKLSKRYDIVNDTHSNEVTYSYYGDYMSYPTYSSTETNSDGVSTEHTFVGCYESLSSVRPEYMFYSYKGNNTRGDFSLKCKDETYYMDGDTKIKLSETIYGGEKVRYYRKTYPSSVKTIQYDAEQNMIDNTVNYEYNEYRDLIKSWDAYAEGDTSNTEHMTEYTYDDTYHIMTGKTYKKDANTTVREEYTLTPNSKAVASKKVYENDNLVSREDYEYADTESANPSRTIAYANVSNDKKVITDTVYQAKSLPVTQTVDGVSVSYTYDGLGRNTRITDANGNTTSYEYDKLGRVIKQTNPDGNIATNTYPTVNAEGKLSENTLNTASMRGNYMRYTYDGLGKIKSVYDRDAEITLASYTYDNMGRVTMVIDGNGNRHTYTYDNQGRKTQYGVLDSTYTPTYAEAYLYDVIDGESSSIKTISGMGDDRIFKTEYTDKYGNKIKETSGDGADISETSYTYNYIGEQVTSTTPNGDTYKVSTEAQANSGTKVNTTDPLGNTASVIYDMLGRETETIDGNGNHTYKEYDNAGRVISEKSKLSGKDAIKKYKYDKNGNVLKESIKNNKVGDTTTYRNIYYTYDRLNRLTSAHTDEEGETRYTYDEMGNITSMTTGITSSDPGVTTRYSYTDDTRMLLLSETDPMGYSESYTYDNNGNVLTKTDKNGTVTSNTYNGIDNVISTTVGEETTSYEYLEYGSPVKSITNPSGSITYSYNNKGMVTSEISARGDGEVTQTYSYDKNGNQTNITISKDGSRLINQNSTYNSLGQLTEVKDNIKNEVLAKYSYDKAGNVTEKKQNGDSMITKYEYNEGNLIKSVENQTIADPLQKRAGTYSKYTYDYYLDGNRLNETDNIGQTKTYTYDNAGRLTSERSARGGGGSQDGAGELMLYKYDARGNRIEKDKFEGSKEELDEYMATYGSGISLMSIDLLFEEDDNRYYHYTYDKNNRLTASSSYLNFYYEEKDNYTYDRNGNLLEDEYTLIFDDDAPENEEVYVAEQYTKTYGYNDKNQMISYASTENNGTSASYAYDAIGQRISKTVNGVTTNHIWDNNGNIVYEYGTKGETTYNRGLGGEIIRAGENYYAYNGHGDTINLLSKDKDSVNVAFNATYAYDAFGNLTENTGCEANNNPFRYNGQYTDDETGLVYLRNRYYDPSIGRFTQEDTYWNVNNMIYGDKQYEEGEVKIPDYSAIAQSTNLYVYCMGDPVNLMDPNGDNWITERLGEIAKFALDTAYWAQKQAQRDFWWCGAEWYLKPNGYVTSAWMLEYSLQDNPVDQWRGNDSRIAELIKNDSGFLNFAYDAIYYLGDRGGDFYHEEYVSFNSGDLYYSVHNAYIQMNAYDMGYGKWYLNCTLTDMYDYTEITTLMGEDMRAGLGTIANDVATVSQWSGAINPYKITVSFNLVLEV